MKQWWQKVWLFLAFLCIVRVSTAVENCSVEGKSYDGKRYHVALSPAWTDRDILHALGTDMRNAKLTKSVGPDGEQRVYLFGRKKIDIVRSASTGMIVTLYIKGGDEYVWERANCSSPTSNYLELPRR